MKRTIPNICLAQKLRITKALQTAKDVFAVFLPTKKSKKKSDTLSLITTGGTNIQHNLIKICVDTPNLSFYNNIITNI